MDALLLMGVSGGEWLPILGIMIAPMAWLLGSEWIVNCIERYVRHKQDAHLHR
jgi:hypothetical protein